MSIEDKKSGNDPHATGTTGTSVDRGDDLVERTALYPGERAGEAANRAREAPAAPQTRALDRSRLGDTLESAEILIQEGLFAEAKRLLRKILRTDPLSSGAKKFLSEIQEAEIEKLLRRDSPLPATRRDARSPSTPVSPQEIEAKLRGELGIPEEPKTAESDERFLGEIESALRGATEADRFALAVGLHEIGLRAECLKLLRPLAGSDEVPLRAASAILASDCSREMGDPLSAEMGLRDALCDSDLPPLSRAAIHYALGETYEALAQGSQALFHFQAANELIPDLRESRRKIRSLGGED